MDARELLCTHARTYPAMQPCDAVKLLYQSVFGGAHMIPSPEAAKSRLLAEYESIRHDAGQKIELLGDTARVYIDTDMDEEQLSLLRAVFCASARHFSRCYEKNSPASDRFEAALATLTELCCEGVFSFTKKELASYLDAYFAAGCPAVSHSEAYRAAYAPAYRVIDAKFVRILPLIGVISRAMQKTSPLVVAIDGRCASG